MKYFLTIILISAIAWIFFSFNSDNANKELALKYDEIISDFEEMLNSTGTESVISEEKVIEIPADSNTTSNKAEENPTSTAVVADKKEITVLPDNILHNVDFTSQAPFRDWSYPWQDACEEAAVLMTMRYFDGRGIEDKYDARDALQEIIDWENENFGFYRDTSATTTMKIITDFYDYHDVRLEYDPTLEFIKRELARGNLITVPTAGRILENPYFTPPGPIYHNIVLIGYDDEKEIFYANDPGIMSGGGFKYSYENIMESIADWSYEKASIDMDKRVILIVGPS